MSNHQIVVEKNIACPLRDGTILQADVYRPHKEGEYPVLMTRLPYNKDLPRYSQMILDPIRAAGEGYVVIIQDVRGRFHSEGEFHSFPSEAEDGYDAVEWAAKLPYSNGKIGMYGLSYFGYTQLAAAVKQPPHLKAIFPIMTFHDLRKGGSFRGGALELGLMESWALSVAPDLLIRKHGYSEALVQSIQQYTDYMNNIDDWYHEVPIKSWEPLTNLSVGDFFFEQLNHELEDQQFWNQIRLTDQFEQIQVPAYHLAGWYDVFLGQTLDNFTEMSKKTDQKQQLIVGPWGHGVFSSVVGEKNFGIHSSGDFLDQKEDLTALQLRWFSRWLKPGETDLPEKAPVKLFVMGTNQWREEQEWPLKRTVYTPYYFHSGGHANSRKGDGLLSFVKAGTEPEDTFVYHPDHPVPSKGGATLYAGVLTMGPRDQSEIEDREDVLVYTTQEMEEPMEVTGPVKVKLWAATDAVDTDFTAKLVDVYPDGRAINLTDGIIRAKYRNGYSEDPIKPGESMEYEIDLWATSNVFLPGHRIRVEISSSSFPRFDRNPNTGKSMIDEEGSIAAHQTIFHDEKHPSCILLPIIPEIK